MEDDSSEDNTLEINDMSGNVSFIKVNASPDLQKSILNATICVDKLDTSDYLDSSAEKIQKKRRGTPNCIICKQKFADKQTLTKHIQKKHKRKTVNDCVHCCKSFPSRKSLNMHIDKEHYDLKGYGHKYPCSTYSLTFTSTDSLEEHEWMHMKSQNIASEEKVSSTVHKSERIIAKKESELQASKEMELNVKSEERPNTEVEIGHIEFVDSKHDEDMETGTSDISQKYSVHKESGNSGKIVNPKKKDSK